MKILVTGGSGFIGSRLIKFLIENGHNVISLDRSIKHNMECKHIVQDISQPDLLNIELDNVDVIYHLAAQSGGYYSLKEPYIDAMWNSVGTMNVVQLALKLKVKKFVYTSSMAIYGNCENVIEDQLPKPISFYGASKLSGEHYVQLLREHGEIPFTIFRLFATYGAGQDLNNKHQGILSIYLDQALRGDEIRITGSRNRVRELVHVSDVVQALYAALTKNEMNNEIFNVTFKQRLTPKLIIDAIGRKIGKKLSIIELDGYVGDQVLITGDNKKLRNTGWVPKMDIEAGIEEFLKGLI